MSEINGQTDDVALLVNWFFCSPFPPYEILKVDKAPGAEVKLSPTGVEGERDLHYDELHPAASCSLFAAAVFNFWY